MEEKLPRSSKPHIGIVTFKIDVRGINSDNTLEAYILGDGDLKKYGMSRKGQFVIKGTSEADCIQKLKKALGKIHA